MDELNAMNGIVASYVRKQQEAETKVQLLDEKLTHFGFDPPGHGLETLEKPARISENEPSLMTEEVCRWDSACARLELIFT
jgi:hypothetical protein